MELPRNFKIYLFFNSLLLLSFSVTINSLVDIPYINFISYIFFHLVFIYLLFYHYHFSLFIIAFIYGIFFDIFLFNQISVHLITFLIFIILFLQIKRFMIQLNSFQISIVILLHHIIKG